LTSAAIPAVLARLCRTDCGLTTGRWASAAVFTLSASAVRALASAVLALTSAVLALSFLTSAAFLLAVAAVATRPALTLSRGVQRVDERDR
jgi:hypothetical protein